MGKKHLWRLIFWENSQGHCPAAEVMREIKESDPNLHEFICYKIRKFSEDWEIEKILKSKYIYDLKNGLMEYKITAIKNEFRMLGIVEYPVNSLSQFMCFHCFHKKSGKIHPRDITLALQRLKEYQKQK